MSRRLPDVHSRRDTYRISIGRGSLTPKEVAYERSRESDLCRGVSSLSAGFLRLQFRPGMAEADKQSWVRFVRRWQQLTGPVMAKGVEDSTFYVYNRLVSMNEVGGIPWPVAFQLDASSFLSHRAEHWPGSMNGPQRTTQSAAKTFAHESTCSRSCMGNGRNACASWRAHFADRRAFGRRQRRVLRLSEPDRGMAA